MLMKQKYKKNSKKLKKNQCSSRRNKFFFIEIFAYLMFKDLKQNRFCCYDKKNEKNFFFHFYPRKFDVFKFISRFIIFFLFSKKEFYEISIDDLFGMNKFQCCIVELIVFDVHMIENVDIDIC